VAAQRKAKTPTRSRFRNVRTVVDGISFASKAEATRYEQLKVLLSKKKIRDLELQPKYNLDVNGVRVTTYRADFRYVDVTTGKVVVEDVKGARMKKGTDIVKSVTTREYQQKKKLMLAVHGIHVQEVLSGDVWVTNK
jgi:hypothetical protein